MSIIQGKFGSGDVVEFGSIRNMEAQPGDVVIYEPNGINHQFVVGFRTENPKTKRYEKALAVLCVVDSGGLSTSEVVGWDHGDIVTFGQLFNFSAFSILDAKVVVVRKGRVVKPSPRWFKDGMTVFGVDTHKTSAAVYSLYAPNRVYRPKGNQWFTLGAMGEVDFTTMRNVDEFEEAAQSYSNRLRAIEFYDNAV